MGSEIADERRRSTDGGWSRFGRMTTTIVPWIAAIIVIVFTAGGRITATEVRQQSTSGAVSGMSEMVKTNHTAVTKCVARLDGVERAVARSIELTQKLLQDSSELRGELQATLRSIRELNSILYADHGSAFGTGG